MSSMGEHISTLELNMLNKKQSETEGQEHIEVSPSDEQMLQTNSHIVSHMLSRHRLKLKLDDEDDTDMMAYSATTAKDTTSNSDDSSSIFGSGGAISEALAESDPSLKEDESKTKEQKEAELKKKKEEEEKKKKLAEKKKKDLEEKRKKDELKRKE